MKEPLITNTRTPVTGGAATTAKLKLFRVPVWPLPTTQTQLKAEQIHQSINPVFHFRTMIQYIKVYIYIYPGLNTQ